MASEEQVPVLPNTTLKTPHPPPHQSSLAQRGRLVPAPLQPASFAAGELKTAQYKPRHEIEATTHSSSTQQQHLKRPRLYFGLPGFANPRTSWSSPKASIEENALGELQEVRGLAKPGSPK